MKEIKRLTLKQLNELKKSLHKIEFDMAVKVVNNMTKILDNSSSLREEIVRLEKDKENLRKKISNLNHIIKVCNEVIDSRDKSIDFYKEKFLEEKNKNARKPAQS